MSALQFLYDDGDIFAVYKPAGVHSVRLANGKGAASIVDLLLEHNPSLALAGKAPEDGGLVHRLDASTSGVLVGAATRKSWELLFTLVLSGALKKHYVACLEGSLSQQQEIEVSSFIGSPYRGAKKMRSYKSDPGAASRTLFGSTSYKLLSYDETLAVSLVCADASPARRHQVRIHAAELGHPLLGDALYGSSKLLGDIALTPREFFLHSWRVSFKHPITGAEIELESPITKEIRWHAPLPRAS